MGVVKKLLNYDQLRGRLPEAPSKIIDVNGHACRVYVMEPPQSNWRMEVWIDGNNLIRGILKQKREPAGTWADYQKTMVEYDVPVDTALFKAEFGAGVRIVSGDATWAERFDLKSVS